VIRQLHYSAKQSVRFYLGLFFIFLIVFVWSAINPRDRLTWFLEVLPAVLAFPILVVSFKVFPLTHLLYVLILVHAIILMIGGHYTYAEVPIFNWLQDTFSLDRNYFDRVGHFFQGFVPAMIAREILYRKQVVKGEWLFFIVCCICLSISACYEFIEWWVAVIAEGAAMDFLGTQGDIWDTQWDMFIALIGAMCAQLLLKNCHNQQLAELDRKV
jgi:putative membrane protein